MRWLIGILIVVFSSCLGFFTSFATVDMLPGREKVINPNPEDNIIGIDESDGSDTIIRDTPVSLDRKKNSISQDIKQDKDTDVQNNGNGINPNDQNDTFDEQSEAAKPYKLFLLMGTDVVYNGSGRKTRSLKGRTDSIMIAKLSNNSVDLLSVPRDSRVNIPGIGFDKINAANVFGGPELLLKTIEKWLNVHIEDYALINTYGIVQFVDLFGGIYFNVPKRMHYTDRTAKLYIDLYPGYQHLDGLKVHNLLRFRHDGMGDLNRVARQQQFLKVMIPKVLSPLNFLKIPSAYGVINDNIETNLSTRKILYLANEVLHINNLKDNIIMHTIPGTGGMYHGGWYWLVDEKGTNKLLHELDLIPPSGNVTAVEKNINQEIPIINNSETPQ